jgi:hypothetical protein
VSKLQKEQIDILAAQVAAQAAEVERLRDLVRRAGPIMRFAVCMARATHESQMHVDCDQWMRDAADTIGGES